MLIEYFNKPTEILSHVHSIFHQLHLPSNIKNMTYIEFIEFLNQSNTFKQMYPMLTSENKKQIIYMLYNKFFNNEESS